MKERFVIRKLQEIIQHGPFKRLFRNTGILLGGDSISAIFGVLTFAVSARALGADSLGMLVLIDAYVRIVDRLINFQSWQFMIKFGSDALARKDTDGFKAIIKFGTLVDSCAALTGCLVSIALASVIGDWQNWSEESVNLARIYSLIIFFNIAGVPTGVLRIFDRFKIFTYQKSICATIKLVGAAAAWFFGFGLKGFLWAWMITEIFDYVSLTVMAWRELGKQGYHGIWKTPLAGLQKKYPGLWTFLISTNLTGSVKVGFRELDILIVGKMLTLTDVGWYKLAKKLCASLDRLTNPLYQSLYPELTKFWAENDLFHFKKLTRSSVLMMGALSAAAWIGFLLLGKPIIHIMAGHEFLGAYGVTVWYLLANGIAITTLPLSPMLLAMGRAHLSFWIQFLPTLVYFPVLYWMILEWGLLGAGYAYILYHGLRALIQAVFVQRLMSRMGNLD